MTTEEHEINLRDINSDDENAELLEGDIENQLHETHRTHLLTERPLVFSKRRFGYFTILYTIMMIVFLVSIFYIKIIKFRLFYILVVKVMNSLSPLTTYNMVRD